VSYLLGIQEVGQLSRHPLRGQLFENLVLMELVKSKYNQGLNTKFYFYRDSSQNEVDILFQDGLNLMAVEVKSSQTFHQDFLKGLKRFEATARKQLKSFVVYSGEQELKIKDCQLINYNHIAQLR
jgi:predicted AAA+ superfamily ATPase